jgi:hypothetical protein
LGNYSRQTGIDLIKHPSAEQVQNCQSPDDVVELLLERELAFTEYRDEYCKLIDTLRPIVKVVNAFSGILGDAAGLARHWKRRCAYCHSAGGMLFKI